MREVNEDEKEGNEKEKEKSKRRKKEKGNKTVGIRDANEGK